MLGGWKYPEGTGRFCGEFTKKESVEFMAPRWTGTTGERDETEKRGQDGAWEVGEKKHKQVNSGKGGRDGAFQVNVFNNHT